MNATRRSRGRYLIVPQHVIHGDLRDTVYLLIDARESEIVASNRDMRVLMDLRAEIEQLNWVAS